MDRLIVYPASIPLDTDVLSPQRNAMIAMGYMMQAAFGTGTIVDGLACTPTPPAGMSVNVGPGSIMALSTIDANAFGSLAADTDPLMKMGINAVGVSNFPVTAPATSGQSIDYLLEAALEEADGTPIVLPYYNADNSSVPYSGPGGGGAAVNTVRAQKVQLTLKAGVAATTGTQVPPAVDTGNVPLYVITVAYGATTVIAGNIAVASGAPFLQFKLPQMTPGFSRVAAFNTPGTTAWVAPAGVTKVRAKLWGAGGGGGGAVASGAAGGGGGGAYADGIYAVIPGTSYPIVIAAGGVAGASTGTAGGNAGSSSFGSFLTCDGGLGGGGAISGSLEGNGGIGGGATGGNVVNLAGGTAQGGIVNGTLYLGAASGASPFGGSVTTNTIGTPFPGNAPGGGGGGGANAQSGGIGASGYLTIEW